MKINNEKNWAPLTPLKRYMFASLGILAVFLLEDYFFPILSTYYPYGIFRILGIFIAIFFGFRPALYTLVIGMLLGSYYFVAPRGEFTPPNQKDLIDWLFWVGLYVGIYLLIEIIQRARYKNELLLRISESRYRTLLDREMQRAILARELEKKSSSTSS